MCALAVVGTSEIEHFDFRLGRFARLRVGAAYLEGDVYVGPVIRGQAKGSVRRLRRPMTGERTETGLCGQG